MEESTNWSVDVGGLDVDDLLDLLRRRGVL